MEVLLKINSYQLHLVSFQLNWKA